MTWNQTSQQWLPDVEVDEDFLAYYTASYGVQYDYDSMPVPKPQPRMGSESDGEADNSNKQAKAGKRLSKEESQVSLSNKTFLRVSKQNGQDEFF